MKSLFGIERKLGEHERGVSVARTFEGLGDSDLCHQLIETWS